RHPEQLMIDIIPRVYRKKCVETRQVVEAMLLSEKAALHLEGLPGSPVRRITRRYLDVKGHAILTTISTHPADRYAFNLNVQIDPEDGRTSFTADGL
ncbi:MAG: UTRA domain-containing protein, partial [Sutterella wadsworthensis]